MAATSPYTPNDYAAVSNFRPYELPINDIFKAISAQNAFWDAGAARVKAVYDNALNLKLSLEPNKEIRKKYMEDAEKQLTKLSSMDLADPSVQRQGFAIFKPLFQDEGIMFDDLTTRHYEKVRNDALMYRSKDNGKGYSDINFQYAMQGYNEFLNSKDRMAGKSFYENRKEYTPYYDYTDDFSKALKDCKPSSIEAQSPNYGKNNAITGYMKESYSKGLSAAQVRGCLEAGLSTNAARQLQIEGAVSYRNNLPVLASDTATYLSGVTGNLSSELQRLAGSKEALATHKDLSSDEKAKIAAAIDEQIKTTSQELDRTNRSVEKLNAGDYTDLQNNFESYAGSVYSYKKLYKKALASSFEERRDVYKADPVQMNAIRFSQEKYLRQMDFTFDVSLEEMKQDFDREMKMYDIMYGGSGKSGTGTGSDVYRNPLTGEITINPNLLPETPNVYDSPDPDEKIYQNMLNQVNDLNTKDTSNNLRLYNNMVSRAERDKSFRENLLQGFNYGITDDEWNRFKKEHANNSFQLPAGTSGGLQDTDWFKTYAKEKPKDEDLNKWSYENTLIETGINVLNRKLEIGEKQVQEELGDYNTKLQERVSKMKGITVGGANITPQQMALAMDGQTSGGLKVNYGDRNAFMGSAMSDPRNSFTLNGKTYYPGSAEYRELNIMAANVWDKIRSTKKDYDKKRADVYNQLGFDREPWYFTPSDDKKSPQIVQTLQSILPKDEKGNDLNIRVVSSDFSGGVRVSVPGVKKGDDTYFDAIRAAGVGTSVESTADGVLTIKGTKHNLVPQAIQNPLLADAAYQLASVASTKAFETTQPGAKVPNADIKVPVMVRGSQETMTIETYNNGTGPEYRVYLDGATDPRPFIIANNAYELFEKIGRSPVDLNKPVK